MVVVLAAGSMHMHHIYHWMDHTLYHEYMIGEGHEAQYVDEAVQGAVANPNYDLLIANKKAYLNQPFFWMRTLAVPRRIPVLRTLVPQVRVLEMDKETGDSLVQRMRF